MAAEPRADRAGDVDAADDLSTKAGRYESSQPDTSEG